MSCDVSRLRYRGGSFSCLPCRFAPPVVPPPSHRRFAVSSIVPSSYSLGRLLACLVGAALLRRPSPHPSSRAICLLAARRLRPAFRSTSRPASRFPSRLSSRSPLDDVIADLPYRSPRLPMLAVINRPALLVARLGAGRGGEPFSSSPVRLVSVACLASVSSACVSSLRSALLAWVPPFVSVL